MLTYNYTIRTLMVHVNMTYEKAYRLVERMRNKGLVKDLGMVKVGAKNSKMYGLMMPPEQYLKEEEEKRGDAPKPPVGFFSNPFNLKNAIDKRWRDDLY